MNVISKVRKEIERTIVLRTAKRTLYRSPHRTVALPEATLQWAQNMKFVG